MPLSPSEAYDIGRRLREIDQERTEAAQAQDSAAYDKAHLQYQELLPTGQQIATDALNAQNQQFNGLLTWEEMTPFTNAFDAYSKGLVGLPLPSYDNCELQGQALVDAAEKYQDRLELAQENDEKARPENIERLAKSVEAFKNLQNITDVKMVAEAISATASFVTDVLSKGLPPGQQEVYEKAAKIRDAAEIAISTNISDKQINNNVNAQIDTLQLSVSLFSETKWMDMLNLATDWAQLTDKYGEATKAHLDLSNKITALQNDLDNLRIWQENRAEIEKALQESYAAGSKLFRDYYDNCVGDVSFEDGEVITADRSPPTPPDIIIQETDGLTYTGPEMIFLNGEGNTATGPHVIVPSSPGTIVGEMQIAEPGSIGAISTVPAVFFRDSGGVGFQLPAVSAVERPGSETGIVSSIPSLGIFRYGNATGEGLNVIGTSGTDTLKLPFGSSFVHAGAGNDRIVSSGHSNVIFGGSGDDLIDFGIDQRANVAAFQGKRTEYEITITGSVAAIRDGVSERDGLDIVHGAQGLRFTDGLFSFHGGQLLPLPAVIGPDPLRGPFVSVIRDGVASEERTTAYSGPVSYLQYRYLGSEAGDVAAAGSSNHFFNLLGGDDAADGGAGDDVLDGGLGSNFLTGGSGYDVFFLDGRAATLGSVTWSTITDWQAGEQLSVWGWTPDVSSALWVDDDGAEGYRGVTMHADIDGNGAIDTSVTWSGMTRAQLPAPLEFEGLYWFT